ncbi:MAG: cobalt-precorrin 5A hydrolase [Firmicutes bacterium]|nr:cobalt-precorrin 5A hydrolase [Bacillota bacterium]
MKIAIYVLSWRGVKLAIQLQKLAWPGVELEIFAHEKWFVADVEANWHQLSFGDCLAENFSKFDAHICIMALGIVVRHLAPLLVHKTVDPAVIVMDELGKFAISAVAGHLGGATVLTEKIAQILEAQAVITTASDGLGRLVPDSYSQMRGWQLEYPAGLIPVNSAIVNDQDCYLYIEPDLTSAVIPWGQSYQLDYAGKTLNFRAVWPLEQWPGLEPAILMTHRLLAGDLTQSVLIRPRNLVVGVGCKRGTSAKDILTAIYRVFQEFDLSVSSLFCLGSIDLKADEIGLLQAAEELQTEIKFVDRQAIASSDLVYTHSDFVKKTVGVGGVCEPVAMILAKRKKLIVPRQARGGITIAVAQMFIDLTGENSTLSV